MRLPAQAARRLPDQSTTLRVDSSSTNDPRLRGALPYRDIIQAPNDLAENRFQLLMASYAAMRRLIQLQKLKLLAVTSRKRIDDADAALLSKLTQSAQQVVRHCDR